MSELITLCSDRIPCIHMTFESVNIQLHTHSWVTLNLRFHHTICAICNMIWNIFLYDPMIFQDSTSSPAVTRSKNLIELPSCLRVCWLHDYNLIGCISSLYYGSSQISIVVNCLVQVDGLPQAFSLLAETAYHTKTTKNAIAEESVYFCFELVRSLSAFGNSELSSLALTGGWRLFLRPGSQI